MWEGAAEDTHGPGIWRDGVVLGDWGQLVHARKHHECFVFLSGVTSLKGFLAQKTWPQSKLRNKWTAKTCICSLLQSGTLSQTTVQVLLSRQMWSLPYLQSDSRPDSLRWSANLRCTSASQIQLEQSVPSFGTLRPRSVRLFSFLYFYFIFWEAKIMPSSRRWQVAREDTRGTWQSFLSWSKRHCACMRKVLLLLRISDGLNAWSTYSCLLPESTGVCQGCTQAPAAHNSAGCWRGLSCADLRTQVLTPSPSSGCYHGISPLFLCPPA